MDSKSDGNLNGDPGKAPKELWKFLGAVGIIVLVITSCTFVGLNIGPIDFDMWDYYVTYHVQIVTNDSDGYFAYVPYPSGNNDLNTVIHQRLKVVQGKPLLNYVDLDNRGALRVICQGNTTIEVNYSSEKDSQNYKTIFWGVGPLDPHSSNHINTADTINNPQKITYQVFLSSSFNFTARITMDFHVVSGPETYSGGFSSAEIGIGWNNVNGTFVHQSMTG
jgi:hypothetical protein